MVLGAAALNVRGVDSPIRPDHWRATNHEPGAPRFEAQSMLGWPGMVLPRAPHAAEASEAHANSTSIGSVRSEGRRVHD